MTTKNKSLTSSYYIWPADTRSTILCEGSLTDNIVDEFGVQVKCRRVTGHTTNRYGDTTKSVVEAYKKAYLHRWTATDDEVKEGIYKNGEMMFVFKTTDKVWADTGNYLFYENQWFKVRDVTYQGFSGTKYLINSHVEVVIRPS